MFSTKSITCTKCGETFADRVMYPTSFSTDNGLKEYDCELTGVAALL